MHPGAPGFLWLNNPLQPSVHACMTKPNTVSSSFSPNQYQIAILDWIRDGRGHAFVEAVAGSGKSSTLVMASEAISGSGIFLAFNRHIADELGAKLSHLPVEVRTIHSLGFAAVRNRGRRVKVVSGKYRNILKALRDMPPRTPSADEIAAIEQHGWPYCDRLVDLVRSSLVDPSDRKAVQAVIDHHALDIHPTLHDLAIDLAREACQRGVAQADYAIDYTDMIWLPSVLRLTSQTYAWVMVDEAQDLSPAQLDVVSRAVAPGGRVLAVGDRRQSIMGFAGADSESVNKIVERFDAKILPLSVCYRCPTSHLDLARGLCPQIEARPDAPAGEVLTWDREGVTANVREGDLVICRRTAPLLKLAYECIAAGISAAVKGRDIGVGLTKLVVAIGKRCSWDGFCEGVDRWLDGEVEALAKRGGDNDSRIEALNDRAECLLTIYTAAKPVDAAAMVRAIDALFNTERPSVVCSTVHRAKGLENGRVIVLDYGRIQLPAKRDWQRSQEENLEYVALTRAKQTLVLVD